MSLKWFILAINNFYKWRSCVVYTCQEQIDDTGALAVLLCVHSQLKQHSCNDDAWSVRYWSVDVT